MDRIIIWWTSEADCKIIGASLPDNFPTHIKEQYQSRYGRNGRGRLWADEKFKEVEAIFPKKESLFTKSLANNYAGIVLDLNEYSYVRNMPGHVTDQKLYRI